ncbi:DUF6165 family protein, partial [Acidimicrobiaceae bacterium]|nr:DUF6165 family protein [Acidimicrobiaceae bacterium]
TLLLGVLKSLFSIIFNMNINIPISYGELVDKLTILEIKQQKIENQDKLKNINNEYLELDEVAKYLKNIDKIEYENFYKKLFEVNLGLWEIEDKIRILEKDKNFDNEFIELARKVYFTNDKRFEIKSEINKHFGSEFFEEKQYVEYE